MMRPLVGALATALVATLWLVTPGPADAVRASPAGFAISGAGHVADGTGADGALVYDTKGRRHLLTEDARGTRHRYTYRVTRRGHTVVHQRLHVPAHGLKPVVREVLDPTGTQVFAVVVGCNGIWTAQGPAGAARLSGFVRAMPGTATCREAGYRAMLDGVAPLADGRLAILASPAYPRTAPPAGGVALPQVYVGTPGAAFTPAADQPEQVFDNIVMGDARLVRDSSTGQLVFVRTSVALDGTQTVRVSAGNPDTGWSTPAVAASGVPSAYADLDASAAGGRVAIVLSRLRDSVTPITADPRPGILLLEGTEAGTWQPPTEPANTDNADVGARVGLAGNGRLSLAFVRCTTAPVRNRAPGVVYTQARSGGGVWSQPRKRSASQRTLVDWIMPGRQQVGFRVFAAGAPGKFHSACG